MLCVEKRVARTPQRGRRDKSGVQEHQQAVIGAARKKKMMFMVSCCGMKKLKRFGKRAAAYRGETASNGEERGGRAGWHRKRATAY